MAEEYSETPVASGQQPVAIPEPATSEVPLPAAEPTAMPEVVVEPEETPPHGEESPRVEETASTPAESEIVANDPETQTAQAPVQTAQRPVVEPFPPSVEPLDNVTSATIAPEETLSQSKESSQAQTQGHNRELLIRAHSVTQDRKRKKLEKIMTELEKSGKITNDEVEKLLHVSDATATRYLSELKKEGKIQQVGKTGAGVVYTKI